MVKVADARVLEPESCCHFDVEVDQRAQLDFALTVGTNTETITVRL